MENSPYVLLGEFSIGAAWVAQGKQVQCGGFWLFFVTDCNYFRRSLAFCFLPLG
jgi:hypothetical protein